MGSRSVRSCASCVEPPARLARQARGTSGASFSSSPPPPPPSAHSGLKLPPLPVHAHSGARPPLWLGRKSAWCSVCCQTTGATAAHRRAAPALRARRAHAPACRSSPHAHPRGQHNSAICRCSLQEKVIGEGTHFRIPFVQVPAAPKPRARALRLPRHILCRPVMIEIYGFVPMLTPARRNPASCLKLLALLLVLRTPCQPAASAKRVGQM